LPPSQWFQIRADCGTLSSTPAGGSLPGGRGEDSSVTETLLWRPTQPDSVDGASLSPDHER
jgi:hypothetical protein